MAEQTSYQWTSKDIQNELLEIMSHSVLRSVISDKHLRKYNVLILDKICDIAIKEQVSICLRVVDNEFISQEYFLGFYNTDATDAGTLFKILKDVLLRSIFISEIAEDNVITFLEFTMEYRLKFATVAKSSEAFTDEIVGAAISSLEAKFNSDGFKKLAYLESKILHTATIDLSHLNCVAELYPELSGYHNLLMHYKIFASLAESSTSAEWALSMLKLFI
ncbi:hypothetical protein HELRODRAFT_162869 [Helobdella robusta]|uniref:Uncharacterized protein n=1 Tax=Helobdella robusta TaxID=6412 RepID=T1ETA8_HELRO|nr:hypothetical protein HELRODRAFT_162869 [Helobdella robusta]ESN99341.1 hypothetical protein HELRODRAFT_162869 [Helobdella robusta]